jgi:hypothetical protein
MQTFRHALVIFVVLAAGALSSGCHGVDASTPEDDRLSQVLETEGGEYAGDLEPESSTKEDGQDVNSAGQCCWGHCSSSGSFYSRSVSSGCRDWVVAVCHNAGLAFNPYGDAWWGSCP